MNNDTCLVCGGQTTKLCSGCKTASYCNKEHQIKDWKAHKDYCRKVQEAGKNTFDAILFPATETKPRIVKVPYTVATSDEEGWGHNPPRFHQLDLSIWFNHPNSFKRCYFVNNLKVGGPPIGELQCFYFDDNFMMNKLPLNLCIVNMTGEKAGYSWCGNIIGLRRRSPRDDDFFASAKLEEDLKVFKKYFQLYSRP